MARATGIGGIFFKSRDPDSLPDWYCRHLNIEPGEAIAVPFRWLEHDRPQVEGCTLWAPFAQDTRYFAPSEAPFMVNFRVEGLDALLEALRAAGVEVDDTVEETEQGRFGWFMDPEGNRVELWEPPEHAG